MQHIEHQGRRSAKRRREPDSEAPARPSVAERAPANSCFVAGCGGGVAWQVTGVRARARSTVLACHHHMLEVLAGGAVVVETVRACPG